MSSTWLLMAAALLLLTGLTHSLLGERRLIGPLMQQREGVLANDLARQVLRFTWHLISALGLALAWLLISYARAPSSIDPAMIVLIGTILAGAGLIDAIYTRGKHVGWPLLFAAGATTLASLI